MMIARTPVAVRPRIQDPPAFPVAAAWRRGFAGCFALLLAVGLALAAHATGEGPPTAGTPDPRVVIATSAGNFTVELYPRWAPRAVARFLARAGLGPVPEGLDGVASYAGLELCEDRAHGYLVFGCLPVSPEASRPRAPGRNGPAPDEIDGQAMGLAGQVITDPRELHWLWQSEIFPRYVRLRERGRPVPPGLESLVAAIRREGMEGTHLLHGRSRLWYLEALGFRYASGRSPLRVERGVLATAGRWPDEADERFLVALAPVPDRDGRATVFGRVVDGWETLEAIARLPVDKSHRTLQTVVLTGMTPPRTSEDGRPHDLKDETP